MYALWGQQQTRGCIDHRSVCHGMMPCDGSYIERTAPALAGWGWEWFPEGSRGHPTLLAALAAWVFRMLASLPPRSAAFLPVPCHVPAALAQAPLVAAPAVLRHRIQGRRVGVGSDS